MVHCLTGKKLRLVTSDFPISEFVPSVPMISGFELASESNGGTNGCDWLCTAVTWPRGVLCQVLMLPQNIMFLEKACTAVQSNSILPFNVVLSCSTMKHRAYVGDWGVNGHADDTFSRHGAS